MKKEGLDSLTGILVYDKFEGSYFLQNDKLYKYPVRLDSFDTLTDYLGKSILVIGRISYAKDGHPIYVYNYATMPIKVCGNIEDTITKEFETIEKDQEDDLKSSLLETRIKREVFKQLGKLLEEMDSLKLNETYYMPRVTKIQELLTLLWAEDDEKHFNITI